MADIVDQELDNLQNYFKGLRVHRLRTMEDAGTLPSTCPVSHCQPNENLTSGVEETLWRSVEKEQKNTRTLQQSNHRGVFVNESDAFRQDLIHYANFQSPPMLEGSSSWFEDGGQTLSGKTNSSHFAQRNMALFEEEVTRSSKSRENQTNASERTCAQEARNNDDVNVDELAAYLDNLVYIPKEMSRMAEMMYA
ncbi:oxidative stress-responsive serine-rich protein 1-like [Limulus polyphemus]|uniref:Oxidative stress-responsive serine-rich protein 1 n=1 Tax=Limulus polyphemus TaxID=6850 RepID=A0ABM1B6X7_LIMPO|nr:oxidative stress-responsive serine-rich protein 1-like [Limulus polyphemus]XP_022243339.1 oxidative stress-responsive serine-rich protein 1-like [Limulus polyphemus]